MQKKSTSDLHQDMMAHSDLNQFLSENRDLFEHNSIQNLLQGLFDRKGITKSVLAKQSGMSEVYLHQVFSGRRNPSRSRILCMCFGMQATMEETQDLLKQAGLAQLYPREKRDAIILYGLLHGMTLFEVNDKLFEEDEETLI